MSEFLENHEYDPSGEDIISNQQNLELALSYVVESDAVDFKDVENRAHEIARSRLVELTRLRDEAFRQVRNLPI